MSQSTSRTRLLRAFAEGRRSSLFGSAENPYTNPACARAWEKGRRMQIAGGIKGPIPPRPEGQTAPIKEAHIKPAASAKPVATILPAAKDWQRPKHQRSAATFYDRRNSYRR